MNTTTKKELKGWRNIFAPKSENIKVADWLRENDLTEDADNIEEWATFADFKKSIEKVDWDGRYHLNNDYLNYAKDNYIDSFLRDVIYDGLRAIA